MERAKGQLKKNRAKQLLYKDIMADGVQLEATDEYRKSTIQLKDLYLMHPDKFPIRG
jgi:hypothetical protein